MLSHPILVSVVASSHNAMPFFPRLRSVFCSFYGICTETLSSGVIWMRMNYCTGEVCIGNNGIIYTLQTYSSAQIFASASKMVHCCSCSILFPQFLAGILLDSAISDRIKKIQRIALFYSFFFEILSKVTTRWLNKYILWSLLLGRIRVWEILRLGVFRSLTLLPR